MNTYAHNQEEIPPYVDKTELGELMISCIAFVVIVQTLTLLGD